MFYQILALLIWSSSFIAAKFAYTMMDAVWMVQMRLLISMLVVLPMATGYLKTVPRQHWPALVFVAFVNHVVVLFLQFIGLQHTSAASAVTIIGLEPLIMVFLGHFCFKDPARPHHWLCGALAFVGVAVLILGGAEGQGGNISLWGCFLVFLGGMAFCAIWRPTHQVIVAIGAPAYTSVSFLIAAPICLPFTLLLADSHTFNWNGQGIAALLYLGIGSSWLAYWLWNKGMNSVSANTSGILTTLEPVFGVLMALLLLSEHISVISALGMVLVIGSTMTAVLLNRRHKIAH